MTKSQYVQAIKALLGQSTDDKAIETALKFRFADIVSRASFEFMLAPDPATFDFTADEMTYDEKIDGLGKINFIRVLPSGATYYKPIKYYSRKYFDQIRAGQIPIDGTCWTWIGRLANGRDRYQFCPLPTASSGTWQVVYFAKPTDRMISRLPDMWSQILVDGVVSYLIKPSERLDLPARYAESYERGVERMLAREPIVKGALPPYLINDYDADRNIENAGLQ